MFPYSENTKEIEKKKKAVEGVAQLVGELSCAPEGGWLESWSGHRARLWLWFLVRVHVGGN